MERRTARGPAANMLILVAFGFSSGSSTAAQDVEFVLEQHSLRLYSAFWPNLHNVLWAEAWARRSSSPSEPSPAGSLPEPLTGNLTSEERAAWEAAVSYYNRELADLDLFFGMANIRKALIALPGELPKAGLALTHRQVLTAAAPVYRKHWWPTHDRANRAWIAEAMPKVASLTPEVPDWLVKLCGTPWFTSPVRVDVVRVGTRQGGFTSKDPAPAHITISSGKPEVTGWMSAEVIFHESSHALFRPMMNAFAAESKAQGMNTGDLWHVALFYMAGEVVRQALASRGIDYQPYLYKTGLFDRAWPQFRTPIETHWKAYVNGQMSREDAIKRIVSEVNTAELRGRDRPPSE